MDRSAGILAQAAALRRFNRFYFGRMRFLREAMTGPGYRAAELRVLREIGESPHGVVAARVALDLRMDPGRLSRILNFFRARGYLKDDRAAGDRRSKVVRLSREGRCRYLALEREAEGAASFLLRLLTDTERQRLLEAMAVVEEILRRVR